MRGQRESVSVRERGGEREGERERGREREKERIQSTVNTFSYHYVPNRAKSCNGCQNLQRK